MKEKTYFNPLTLKYIRAYGLKYDWFRRKYVVPGLGESLLANPVTGKLEKLSLGEKFVFHPFHGKFEKAHKIAYNPSSCRYEKLGIGEKVLFNPSTGRFEIGSKVIRDQRTGQFTVLKEDYATRIGRFLRRKRGIKRIFNF